MILLESEKNQNSERHTCIVISTPGLNDWAKETYEQSHYSSIKSTNNHKRSLDKDNSETTNYLELIQKKGRMSPIDNNEKMETMKCNTRQQSAFSKEYILNFPFPMDDGIACIVKVINEFLTFIFYIILMIFK